MTDKEKAIVMAHTGICMLAGDKFQIFHKYVEDIMGRSIMTHEIGWLADTIKEKTKTDFLALCEDESGSEKPNNCEDCISRAEAIKAMDDLEQEDIELYGCSIPEGFDGKRAIEALQSLPSVTPNMSENPTSSNCTDCILDGTDACSRGAGRAVDGRVCEDFVGESED